MISADYLNEKRKSDCFQLSSNGAKYTE